MVTISLPTKISVNVIRGGWQLKELDQMNRERDDRPD